MKNHVSVNIFYLILEETPFLKAQRIVILNIFYLIKTHLQ